MSVAIRLRRIGKNPKKKPHFRVSVFNSTRGRDSSFLEEIGYYNPLNGVVKIDKERFAYWKEKGAVISQAVASLIKK